MKIKYVAKNYKISNKFKEILEKKLEKLNKYFPKGCDAKVNCSKQNDNEKLEITLSADNRFIRAEVVSDNMYNNIDTALPKVEKQIIKMASKRNAKAPREVIETLEFLEEMPVVEVNKVVKTKKFDLDPLTVEDAKYNLEALGHAFYIFLNAESGKICVLYKRDFGDLGLIEVNY